MEWERDRSVMEDARHVTALAGRESSDPAQ